MMLAALGGGCMSTEKAAGPAMHQHGATARARTAPGPQAAWGESVAMTAQAKPGKATAAENKSGIVQAGYKMKNGAEGIHAPPPGSVAALGSLPGLPVGGPGSQTHGHLGWMGRAWSHAGGRGAKAARRARRKTRALRAGQTRSPRAPGCDTIRRSFAR